MALDNYQLLHFSVRPRFKGTSGFRPFSKIQLCSSTPYAIVNIVFRAKVETPWVKHHRSEYREVYAADSMEIIEKYHDGIELNFNDDNKQVTFGNKNNLSFGDVYKKRFTFELNPIVNYIEKFDVYQYREYVEWNPITIGIFQQIELLDIGAGTGMIVDDNSFERCLQALDLFWH